MISRIPLDNVCDKKIETLSSHYDGKIEYVDISSVDNAEKVISSTQIIDSKEAPSRAKQLVKNGDILVSMVRPNLNAVAVIEKESDYTLVASTGYCVLRCNKEFNNHYIFYFCQSPYFIEDMVRQATGASYPAVSNSIVKSCLIPSRNLEEQQHIAAVLDRISNLISLRKQQLDKLDELVKARFVEMFGDPVINSMGWEQQSLKELTSKIGSGATPKGGKESYQSEGITLIRSMNVHDGKFEHKDLAHITEEQAKQLDNVEVYPNDVFINITGASVARSCIVPDSVLPARVNQHVAIIRCKPDRLNYIFVNNQFLSPSYKKRLLALGESGGATRQAITKQQLEELNIIVPPLELQSKFSEFVTQVEQSKLTIQQGLDKLEVLKKALMQEYFG